MAIRYWLVSAILLLTLLGACASNFRASYDHDSSHDFKHYQTFAWISKNPMKVGNSSVAVSPLLQPRIMSALENGLVAKGYRLAKVPEDADFVLSFTVGSRDELQIDSYLEAQASPRPSSGSVSPS